MLPAFLRLKVTMDLPQSSDIDVFMIRLVLLYSSVTVRRFKYGVQVNSCSSNFILEINILLLLLEVQTRLF